MVRVKLLIPRTLMVLVVLQGVTAVHCYVTDLLLGNTNICELRTCCKTVGVICISGAPLDFKA